jgi:hypothetical protein
MRHIHPGPPYIKNRARGDWLSQGVKALILAEAEDISRAKEQFTGMLEALGIGPETVADNVRLAPVEMPMPAELREDGGNTATVLRLILHKHRSAIGFVNEAALSGAIDRLNRGLQLTAIDYARIRDARARARLAFNAVVA